jgi:hypothetical protein
MTTTNPPWKDHPARSLLLDALIAGKITQEAKPREVFDMYKDDPSFDGLQYNSTFTRRLRELKKKAMNKEADDTIDWKNHPAKKFLYGSFVDGTISVGYSSTIGPKGVWDQYCKDNHLFADMTYGDAFTRRLKSVEQYYEKKAQRAVDDQKAFNIFRANHPIKTEGRWAGSEAQKRLKEDMANGLHLEYAGRPRDLRDRDDRPEYKQVNKQKFRDHIQQEKRLTKFHNYLDQNKKS